MYSLLSMGTDRLRTWRNMTADALGAMFPFTKKVHYDPEGHHHGIRKYNGTWVVLNPLAPEMDNASELVLGRPGRGKSAYFKQQIDLLVTLGQWTAVSTAAAAQPVHLFVDEGWHLLPPDRADLYKTDPEH
jgi:hypothetical protein